VPRARVNVAFQVRLAEGQTHCRIFDREDSPADVRAWVATLMGIPETEYSLRIDPGWREFPSGKDLSLALFAPSCSLKAQLRGVEGIRSRAGQLWRKIRKTIADFQFIAGKTGDPTDFWRSTTARRAPA
jgi:hypothetical protein